MTTSLSSNAELAMSGNMPSDTISSDSQQALHRISRVRLAALWTIVAKFGSLLVTLISIPLAISTLGDSRFGIWITITTFFSLFNFLDGGIGNAVINMVADHRASKSDAQLRRVISSAYLMLYSIGGLGCIFGALAAFAINWKWAISLPPDISQDEVAVSALIVGVLFFANMPLSLVARIRQGLQETHINAVFDILSYIIILVGTVIAWYLQASLNCFLLVFASGPVIANALNTISMRFRKDLSLIPRYSLASKEIAFECLTTGSIFLGLQICAALAFQTDALIVSHLVGLPAAAELGLVNRMFMVATSVTSLFIGPLWPAIRDATVRGETEWIRNVVVRAFGFSVLVSLTITLPLLLGYKLIIPVWIGSDAVMPSFPLVLAVFLWTNLFVIGNLTVSILNGLNQIRLQLVLGIIMVIVNLPISVILTLQLGPSGVVFGSVISYSLTVLVPFVVILPRLLKRAHSTVSI